MTATSISPGAPAASAATPRRGPVWGILLLALVGSFLLSLAVGANPLSIGQVWHGLVHPDASEASIIVWTERMPRTMLGIAIGAALGVSGALIQALTRNPLADPGILGVNAGAGFAVTIGVGLFGLSGMTGYIWWAFLGAAGATVLVYVIGSLGRSTSPVTMVLAGVALSAVLGGLSTFLSLIDDATFESIRAWGVGSIARVRVSDVLTVLPFLAIGLALAIGLSGPLNAVALGDDLAASLGTSVVRTRVLGILAITLLAGGATALTGGIGFVGLMVPHVVRWATGPDQRRIIFGSALGAPSLLLVSDVVGRIVVRPAEIEVGIVTAVIGAPVLIALVRRRNASAL